jgi:hypothetical protein
MASPQNTLDPNSSFPFLPFPKITGKINEFLVNLDRLSKSRKFRGSQIQLEGTVKLHGMHGDIVYDLSVAGADVIFQSRNRICNPDESQQGWPRNISKQAQALKSLKSKILTQYKAKNPTSRIDVTKPLIVAGEWIGHKVQPGVGVSQLSARFVILSIQINGIWQPDPDISGISEPSAAIFNITDIPPFVVTYDIADRSPTNSALHQMQGLADQVETVCPYAAHFGVVGGRGEGIVWKAASDIARGNPKYWFKMKGPISDPVNHININPTGTWPVQAALSPERAAKMWVTTRRVQQAFEYLSEMNFETRGQRERAFTKWLTTDILTEERTEIEKLASDDLTFIKRLREQIYFQARAAFLKSAGKAKHVPCSSQPPPALPPPVEISAPAREMTNEERFLAAMEQMLKKD